MSSGKAKTDAKPARRVRVTNGHGGNSAMAAMHRGVIGYDRGDTRFKKQRAHLSSSGVGGDYYLGSEHDRLRIIETCRDIGRNSPIVRTALNIYAAQVVGDGMKVDPATGSEELDRVIRARWERFSQSPELFEAAGRSTIHGLAEHATVARFTDGDAFVLHLRDGRAQFLEAHRCRTPTYAKPELRKNGLLTHGVETDRYGRAIRYFFTRHDVPSFERRITKDQLAEENAGLGVRRRVLHLMDADRHSMTRSMPAMTPIIRYADMLDDFTHATLVKAVTSACVTFIRTMDAEFDLSKSGEADELGPTITDTLGRKIQELVPGLEIELRPGEDMKMESPNVPSPTFDVFTRGITQIVGMVFDVPLVMLRMDGSETNFSGWRGAVDIARKRFGREQRRLVQQLYAPLYRSWLNRSLNNDGDAEVAEAARRIEAERVRDGLPELVFDRAQWATPRWPYIEPLKDAQADTWRQQHNLDSPRRLHAQRGQDWNTVAAEAVEDRAEIIMLAARKLQQLRDEFGELVQDVTLRDLAGGHMASEVRTVLTTAGGDPDQQLNDRTPEADDDDDDT